MGKMNKSFIYGIIVASITWIISFYLYCTLIYNYESTLVLSLPSNNNTGNKINLIHSNNNKINNNNDDDIKKDLYMEKMLKFKKERKFRKISQKLRNELRPIKTFQSDEFGMVQNAEDQFVRDNGYKRHAFNTLISNKLGLIREIPDTRHKLCSLQKYEETYLPTTSVIICFYNEHIITLLRSIKTVMERTPRHLLKEIILVDDFSEYNDLKEKLETEIDKFNTDYNDNVIINKNMQNFKLIRLLRNDKREGLIRSRVYGARNSTGDILMFLDSHIEVNNMWLEPLLSRIHLNRTILVMPVIDIINADTFAYTSSPLVRGGFNWGLHFKWDNLPDGTLKNDTDFLGPFKSPTMAGGLFAVDRKYFKEIGEYDMGMDIWGGENIEISFRVWQCGGSIELIPCSRVGHVFRKRRPYGSLSGTDTMLRNSLRLANVWMDEYVQYFLQQQNTAKNIDFGDINDRLLLKKELNCKPFSWYLKNIYPELSLPGTTTSKLHAEKKQIFRPWHSRKRNYVSNFMIRSTNSTLCITISGNKEKSLWKRGSEIILTPCQHHKNQIWYQTDKSELVVGQLLCLEAPGSSSIALPVVNKCHEMGGDQDWRYRASNSSPIYNMASGTCLSVKDQLKSNIVSLELCSSNTFFNSWDLI